MNDLVSLQTLLVFQIFFLIFLLAGIGGTLGQINSTLGQISKVTTSARDDISSIENRVDQICSMIEDRFN